MIFKARFQIYLLLYFSVAVIISSCSSSKTVSRNVDHLIDSEEFEQSFAGLIVYDPGEKKTVYEHNAGKYFTPASNIKLFTFYAGLKVLGDSVPGLKYVTKNDSLIFWGTGDPSLLYADLPGSRVLDFLKNRREKLFYLPPSYKEKHFGPGWAWDDYNDYYSAERSAFPVYGNYAVFEFSPGDTVPGVTPDIFHTLLISDPEITIPVLRSPEENIFRYKKSTDNRSSKRIVPFKYSYELFVDIVSKEIGKPIEIIEAHPKDLKDPTTLYSISSDSLYKQMLHPSDNFVAEQILLMVAHKVSDTLKTDIAISHVLKNYLKGIPDEPKWVDGSGLSRYNLVTPGSMIYLLEKIGEIVPQEKLFHLLPTGGETGTLKNWYKAEEPYVFAKTGTLRHNHALSGFLKTKSGKLLIFSFLNNNYVIPSAEIKEKMEVILKSIHESY